MKDFAKIYHSNRRKVVLHETCYYKDDFIISRLNEKDVLFFDDCLYSQYVFFKKTIDILIKKHITIVFSFSTGIFRHKECVPCYYARCGESHDEVHNGNTFVLNNYMSLAEIHEICRFDNVFLACHGQQHLQLEKIDKVDRSLQFLTDIKNAYNDLTDYNLVTNIFVYPYAFDNIIGSDKLLKQLGYKFIFANKNNLRIVFESLDSRSYIYG